MKTLVLIISMAAISYPIAAQHEQDIPATKNEINLNTVYLFGGYPEISYERSLGKRFSLGLTLGYRLYSKERNYVDDLLTFDYAALPYYRFYFGKKRASGFFLEGNGIVFSRTDRFNDEKETGAGIGIGIGLKFRIKNDWSLGAVAGGGFNVLQEPCNNDYLCFPDMYPRLGITIGKRF